MEARQTPLFAAYPAGYPAAFVVGDTVSLSLFVPASSEDGNPVEPLHRHRVRVVTGKGKKPFPQVYPDPRSDRWEEYVASKVVEQIAKVETQGYGEDFTLPIRDSRVLMTLRFNLPKPKSYPKRVVHHTKKPDIDNYAKAVIDGLVKGRVIEDDGMVTDLMIMKRYIELDHPEGVEIDLTAIRAEVP